MITVLLRLEIALVGLFFTAWGMAALAGFGLIDLAGLFHLDLYPYYSLAAAVGWVSGNVYVVRRRTVEPALHRRVLGVYFLGPPGVLYLLRVMAPAAVQAAMPLVPVYAFGVFAALFLVPVILRPPRLRRPRLRPPH